MTTSALARSAQPRRPDGTSSRSGPSPLLFVPIGRDRSPCDLLYAEPIERIDLALAREALTFAFASGDGEVFTRLLDHTPVAPSRFVAEDFERDIQLTAFVQRCMPVHARGHTRAASLRHLRNVLAAPPLERAHVEFRQQICAELASSAPLAERLEELYVRLVAVRHRLSRVSIGAQEGIDRRLGILAAVRAVIECMAADFAGTTSGLIRLHHYGRAMAESPGYRRLCELLEYEQRRAECDLRISVGFDGRIRSFQALERRENRSSAFYSTPLGRLWTLLSLLLGGYRVTTGEILSRLLDDAFTEIEPFVVFFFQLIGDLEVYLAALGFRRMAAQAGLEVCLPELTRRGGQSLSQLFNPWLVAEGRPCVPCDLTLDDSEHLVFVTGPNSGGKTRLLQSLCLSQLLGQNGLFVPAARAELCYVNGLFASLIEHTEVDQAEGRLGTELLRIRRVFERLKAGSMVVMDELCSGTNPSEGEELMRIVLEALYELRPRAFITTHFLEFASELASGGRHRFVQAELDAHEQPTYKFVDGVARTSLAHRVAERLGVTRESLRALVLANNPELRPVTALGRVPTAAGSSASADDRRSSSPSARDAVYSDRRRGWA